jgi:hypothetical protein
MNGRAIVLFAFSVVLLLNACGYDNKKGATQPIVIGDSATIVTETDPKYLSDFVSDVQLQTVKEDTVPDATEHQPVEAAPDPVPEQKPAQEAENTPPPPQQQPAGQGLDVPFKEAHVFIPNILARSYRNQNPQRANGVTYELTSGNLNAAQVRITEGEVTKVSQRYQTIVVARNELGQLQLESLNHTTAWKPLRGGNNSYTIAIDPRRLESEPATPANIRNSVTTAARRKRLSRDLARRWQNSVSNVRSVNQRPLSVILKSVILKVEGKNEKGRPFQKQIRIDIPVS